MVLTVSGASFLKNTTLHKEVFGPYSLVVACADASELKVVVDNLEGQLTGTILAEEGELAEYEPIIEALKHRVGRIIFNGVPTGVVVCAAMQHGGPYPASSDSRFTAVGIHSIKRWVRPLCYQEWPQSLLPVELRDDNPLKIIRLVNNELTDRNL
jgi:NADP-dependent aldehyde dehydrogenase